jgi:hypothetical protein
VLAVLVEVMFGGAVVRPYVGVDDSEAVEKYERAPLNCERDPG